MSRFIPRALRDQVPPKGSRTARRTAQPARAPRPSGESAADAAPAAHAEPATGADPAGADPAGPEVTGSEMAEVRVTRRRPSPRPRPPAPADADEIAELSIVGLDDATPERTASRATRPPVKAPARPGGNGRSARGGQRPRKTASTKTTSTGRPGRRGKAAVRRADRVRRLTRLHRAAVVLAVLVVLAATGAVLLWRTSAGGDATAQARDEAVSVAQAAAPAILSYDYRTFDASVARGEKYTGGKFAKQYATSTHGLKASAKKEKAVVRAAVAASSVVSATPDKVVLLLYVDQYRQNVNIDGQKVDQDRVVMTMTRSADSWKVTKVIAI